MDHLGAATVAQNALDFSAFTPDEPFGIGAGISDEAAPEFPALGVLDDHCIAPVERAFNFDHPRRKQAAAAVERLGGAGVDDDGATRFQRPRDPALA